MKPVPTAPPQNAAAPEHSGRTPAGIKLGKVPREPGHSPASSGGNSVSVASGYPPAADAALAGGIITRSALVLSVLDQALRVAGSKAPVLLEGESGTGKELLARFLHSHSRRADQAMVCVNCAALPESLVESEFFGHERGAFTGAEESRPGRFELAHGGTLLLDEVSEMSHHLQAKLLRALEEEEFERVGGTGTLRVDVRVIATTNRDLEQEVARGRFRHDLYYRLNTVVLTLPPLRARREDIPPLAEHFIARCCHEAATPVQGISAKALELLAASEWPGNIRQLRNAICRACLLTGNRHLQPADFPPPRLSFPSAQAVQGKTLAEIEREAILATLREVGGNRSAAAHRLGISSRTLFNKLKRYCRQDAA